MAAIPRLQAFQDPPFPMRQVIPYESYPTLRLQFAHTPQGANNEVVRKHTLPFCPDASNRERLIRTLHEFTDACADTNLHINNGDRYVEIRHVLGGDLKNTWDAVIANIAAADRTNANWEEHLRRFTRRFFNADAFVLQGEYLANARKPYGMDVYAVAGRLSLVSMLAKYLPGSNGNELFTTATQRKNGLFRVMPPQWQLRFASSGHSLDDDAYSYENLTDFLDALARLHNIEQSYRNQRRRQSPGRFQSRYRHHQTQPPNYQGNYHQAPAVAYSNRSNFQPQDRNRQHVARAPHFSPIAPRRGGGFPAGRGRGARGNQYHTPIRNPVHHTRRHTRQTGQPLPYVVTNSGGSRPNPVARRHLFYQGQDQVQSNNNNASSTPQGDVYFHEDASPPDNPYGPASQGTSMSPQQFMEHASMMEDQEFYAEVADDYMNEDTTYEPTDWMQDY